MRETEILNRWRLILGKNAKDQLSFGNDGTLENGISCFDLEASIWAGFAAAFGHCYPVFAGFRGGKAVATMFGFLLSTSIFTFQSAWYLIVPFAVFLVVLYAGKMVSLSSMCAALTSSIYITVMQLHISVEIVAASWLLTILVIYRHRANIVKIKNGTENKISWL